MAGAEGAFLPAPAAPVAVETPMTAIARVPAATTALAAGLFFILVRLSGRVGTFYRPNVMNR